MKFVFSLLIFSLAFSIVACSSIPPNRSTTISDSDLSVPEQEALYENISSECTLLRKEFEAARIVNRDLGRKWRKVRRKLSGEGRRHFGKSHQISLKFNAIQVDSKDKMRAQKQEIISKLPSYDASICDTEGMAVITFPPMATTDLR